MGTNLAFIVPTGGLEPASLFRSLQNHALKTRTDKLVHYQSDMSYPILSQPAESNIQPYDPVIPIPSEPQMYTPPSQENLTPSTF